MVNIVLVSHSKKMAEGLQDLLYDMVKDSVRVVAVGGLEGDSLGTDAGRILNAIEEVYTDDGVVVITDLGSAVVSAQMAINMIEDEKKRNNVRIADCPFLEGAVAAVLEASIRGKIEDVLNAAQQARDYGKIV
ncbi:dihydroxyacetone kinase, phosphotransfer subunit [Caldanaerobius fijiensis DSM 17918]|uniref:phosphoenolpyruvate--glycerone phosphotransferase n=1 Tax=Caldanaerobius fijiensis DSM 17918 TaxID=1121256 RepID=A0A1M5A9Y2_9THEO|nr:dihydroxyacetone kinase phosphoryl donor subunit DhaM [Caldanaerobius fijiensis]SHF27079.1 dihydroxyacetone kinase, phosphotransfer subunit [Caldanaerobius fijiensis DSM 17918]